MDLQRGGCSNRLSYTEAYAPIAGIEPATNPIVNPLCTGRVPIKGTLLLYQLSYLISTYINMVSHNRLTLQFVYI